MHQYTGTKWNHRYKQNNLGYQGKEGSKIHSSNADGKHKLPIYTGSIIIKHRYIHRNKEKDTQH